jgi:pimeloyl-ACP methyl ester carboxylesterase
VDQLTRFLSATFDERLDLIAKPGYVQTLGHHLGIDVTTDYQRIAALRSPGHLGAHGETPLVFVPGVMGSVLLSRGLTRVWWLDMTHPHYIDRLRLDPRGRADADARACVESVGIGLGYEKFFESVHAQPGWWPVDAHYDWRRPASDCVDGLAAAIEAATRERGVRADVVAHSMGGLLVRVALMTYPRLWDRIGRVVFLGTPHYGSPSISGYLKNHLWGRSTLALLGVFLSPATLRSMWGVLSLLPAPASIYPDSHLAAPGEPYAHPCANFDLYDAQAWDLGLPVAETATLQQVLDAAAAQHRALATWHDGLNQEKRDRMAIIAGVGYKTLFRTAYHPGLSRRWQHMDLITRRSPGDPHRDGDGRVPVASAQLPHLAETRYIREKHDTLPNNTAVQQDTFRFLSGNTMRLPDSPAGALLPHLAADPALATASDDPGFLDLAEASESDLRILRDRLNAGDLPDFATVRIL